MSALVLSAILTALATVAFGVATFYGIKASLVWPHMRSALWYLTIVAGLNFAYRFFTLHVRLVTGESAAVVLGEWVVWLALSLQFALAIGLMVAIAMSYWREKHLLKLE